MASASKAQIRANRQNAKRSTGPKTKEGKTIVSKNAVTHGAYIQNFMNEIEEAHYQLFLDELQRTYPSNNPLIKSQLERFAKTKTILDRVQRTLSSTFAVSESSEKSDTALMDLLKMDEDQRKVAQQIIKGDLKINEIINVRRVRIASELANVDTSTFTSHDDYLFHTPVLCRFLFDEATEMKIDIDRYVSNHSAQLVNSDMLSEKIIKMLCKNKHEESHKDKKEIDIYAPYPPPKTIETEINKASLANLSKAADLFKKEHNQLADIHHKVITFNKLRSFEVSPIALNLDQLDKLFKFQSGLQNQYSKILGELIAMTSNKAFINL